MDCILARAMHWLDVLGVLLILGASAAFVFGALALSRSSDVEAVYHFVIGFIVLRAGVQIVRPGADT